jgi:hypothetical protein
MSDIPIYIVDGCQKRVFEYKFDNNSTIYSEEIESIPTKRWVTISIQSVKARAYPKPTYLMLASGQKIHFPQDVEDDDERMYLKILQTMMSHNYSELHFRII